MGAKKNPNFSGYATKSGIKCADGRTIMPDAFAHQDKVKVPLVWQHGHDNPDNVLGHAILENREDGVYAYGYFNESPQGKNAQMLVEHGDITALSIFANQLKEKAANVVHGMIRELSLVIAGANNEAFIDNVTLAHADGTPVVIDDEAIIYSGEQLKHEDATASTEKPADKKSDDSDKTVADVLETMNDEQKAVVEYVVGQALDSAEPAKPAATKEGAAVAHSDTSKEKEGERMSRNLFEQNGDKGNKSNDRQTLSHDDLKEIVATAKRPGNTLKSAMEDYALSHGIENLEVLFPDAKTITNSPEFDQRRIEWVSEVINGVRKAPFTRIKSIFADITHEAARAKGYIKGTMKKEEYFGLAKRVTTPATIYKKQKLDRDDILDVTDLDVVAWLKAEMRLMLDEEMARAILIGDGRDIDDPDHIKDPRGANEGAGIRAIAHDDDLYAATINLPLVGAQVPPAAVIDAFVENMRFYKGSGSPTFYTTLPFITRLLMAKDSTGRRMYNTRAELADAMGVAGLVPVESMEEETTLLGILVNLRDYTIGTDKGGDVTFFDDFDIDFNQFKYLLETRVSGALTKIRSALVFRTVSATEELVAPEPLVFNKNTGVISAPTQEGVTYRRGDTNAVITSNLTLQPGASVKVYAQPETGFYFSNNVKDEWVYTREQA